MEGGVSRAFGRTILVVLLLLAPALLAPAASGAEPAGAEKAIWGPWTMKDGASAFPVYEELGVDVYQVQLEWSRTARSRPANPWDPADPAYNWPASLDFVLAEAQRTGIEVAVMLIGTPSWANGGQARNRPPADPQDFAGFATAAAVRYPSVRRWMVWGEPNRPAQFFVDGVPANHARAYAALLDAAYPALKGQSRSNIVIGGMTYPGGGGGIAVATFIENLRLPNGRPPRLDEYGHNPLPFRPPRLESRPAAPGILDISDTGTLDRLVRRTWRGTGPAPGLWLSEFTVQTDNPSHVFDFAVSREEQARWITAAYRIANTVESVTGLGWITLYDRDDGANFGILTSDGQRKPGFGALMRAPSLRFAPQVRTRRSATRRVLASRRGHVVDVVPKAAGTIRVALVDRRGRTVGRARARGRVDRRSRVRLRTRRARRGRHTIEVTAPRGVKVVERVRVR